MKELALSLQKDTFRFFLDHWNPQTGLVANGTERASPSSMASNGLALSTYIVGVKRNFITRAEATNRTLLMLRFLRNGPQSQARNAMGYKGFYYHFLDITTGQRSKNSELSTIDTALFIAGALSASEFFSNDSNEEREIRSLVKFIYERVDWYWALNGENSIVMKWTPEEGFGQSRWNSGYNEAMILYILALGSPTHAISSKSYKDWTTTFPWREDYGISYIYAGPLFIHQLSQIWIDFRKIRDHLNETLGIDYFENSVRATHVQRQYAIENPNGFKGYGPNSWGITSSYGPGPIEKEIHGVHRSFFDYRARGVPLGPDDGTLSPWIAASSLPFAPQIALQSIRHSVNRLRLLSQEKSGLESSYNPTFQVRSKRPTGWIAPIQTGVGQGPVVLMIENYFSGFLWDLMKGCQPIRRGLVKAGFRGGWLKKGKH